MYLHVKLFRFASLPAPPPGSLAPPPIRFVVVHVFHMYRGQDRLLPEAPHRDSSSHLHAGPSRSQLCWRNAVAPRDEQGCH